jgi:SAM-dependent methyltransferase
VSEGSARCPACGAGLPDHAALRGFDRLHATPGAFEIRVCSACGSGRTFPVVSAEEVERFYPEGYNAFVLPRNPVLRALATGLFRWRFFRALRRPPLGILQRVPPGRLLDVGAGRGDLAVVLRARGWDVTGLEPSQQACEEGRRRGARMVRGALGDAAAAELGEAYDVVVFRHALEHVVEPREDLGRARELLRPEGVLVIALPNFGSWQSRRFGSAWFHLDLPRHRVHLTARGLEELLHDTGFEQVQLTTATTSDGLLMSLEYRLFGRRVFRRGMSLYVMFGLSLILYPLSAVASFLAGEGDELHAVAIRPSG